MSFKSFAAHSSRIKKTSKPPSFKRNASINSPYSSLPRRKPIQKSFPKPGPAQDEGEDLFDDRLDDVGLVGALATDLTLRDVAQAILYSRGRMFSSMPEHSGMNSVRTAEVLNFRANLPPVVTVTHIQALLNSPTSVEREIAELIQGGVVRRVAIGSRGALGELLVMVRDMDDMIEASILEQDLKKRFMALLHQNPVALKFARINFSDADAKALMHAGFVTAAIPAWSKTDVFSRPGDGSKSTMTSLNSISKAASGSMAAVGGEGAVHNTGGSGGGIKLPATGDFELAFPGTGSFLKLLSSARTHLLSLLGKSKYREAPESLLRERWDGGISADDGPSSARKSRGEFSVLPGRTRRWKFFYGMSFEFILTECVGAGLVEVFNTGSVGRAVRALK